MSDISEIIHPWLPDLEIVVTMLLMITHSTLISDQVSVNASCILQNIYQLISISTYTFTVKHMHNCAAESPFPRAWALQRNLRTVASPENWFPVPSSSCVRWLIDIWLTAILETRLPIYETMSIRLSVILPAVKQSPV